MPISNPRGDIDNLICSRESITATSEGVAASLNTVITEITTNGDGDLDKVTLANGTVGQMKIFVIKAQGNPSDTLRIYMSFSGGHTYISYTGSPEQGCILVYTSAGWTVPGTHGGSPA